MHCIGVVSRQKAERANNNDKFRGDQWQFRAEKIFTYIMQYLAVTTHKYSGERVEIVERHFIYHKIGTFD